MRRGIFFDDGLFFMSFSVALGIVALIIPAKGATTDDFLVRTTSDFVDLCDTHPDQPNYVAAVHFCQGFATGAFQYYLSLAKDPSERYVCLPDPPPTRDAAMASFVAWARAHPDSQSAAPVDSIFRYLAEAYPCAPSGKTTP